MVTTAPTQAGPARGFGLLGVGAELGASALARRRLGVIGDVYRTGRAGAMDRLATWLSGVGVVVTWSCGRRRLGGVVGGAMLVGGSLAKRFAVMQAGVQSANDPASTIGPQRRRLERDDGGDVAGLAPGSPSARLPISGRSSQ